MLILWRLATGEVVDNTGTNSLMPEGPPDDLAFINTDAAGIARDGLELLRLHDVEDAELVQQILEQRHHVDPASGQVVLDGPHAEPTPEPVPDPDLALADRIQSATTVEHLKAALLGDGATVAVAARVKDT